MVSLNDWAVGALAQYALDQLWAADQNDGCCPKCCLPCNALEKFLHDGVLDLLVSPEAEGSVWFVDGKVDREWLARSWRLTSCHTDEDDNGDLPLPRVVHTRSHGWCHECGGTGNRMIEHIDKPKDYVLVKDFLKALGDAGILHNYPNYSRVVINADINVGVVQMYVEHIPGEALLCITPLMKDVQVSSVDDHKTT